MKRFIVILGGALGLGASGFTVAANNFEPIVPIGAKVGPVDVGGLTPEEAKRKLRGWWDSARRSEVEVKFDGIQDSYGKANWSALGLVLDDAASIDQIPLDGLPGHVARQINLQQPSADFQLVFTHNADRYAALKRFVDSKAKQPAPPRVQWVNGKIYRRYETSTITLNEEAISELVQSNYPAATEITLPTTEAPKRIPDEELNRIVEPMATFTTKFSASNRPRSANIKTASGTIDGLVLMPGESFSFNGVVGPRTIAKGYKEAGVYVQGRHDVGVGGGICQVSTTLYNAVLMANLKIDNRLCHSLPVPYVPTGRDATVSYGSADFVFTNTADHPIALDSTYANGSLTFRILGVKVPGQEIVIERGSPSYRSRGTKFVHDPSLPYGKTKLVDRGGSSIRVNTWRVIKQDGKVIKREDLGTSVYVGAPALYARNMTAKPPAPKPAVPAGPAGPPAPGKPLTTGSN